MLVECRHLLNGIVLQSDVSDRRQWDPNIAGGYTVRGVYQILTTQTSLSADALGDMVWHKQVPLKVSIFMWRLLQDRLTTKTNLMRRNILHQEVVRCVAGCEIDESMSHLFLRCDVFISLWQLIRSWIGVSGVDPHNIGEHFTQFIHYTGHSKKHRSFLQLIWLLCIWLVWNERNNRLFNNTQTPVRQLMDKVKFHSLWWLKTNNVMFVYDSQRWWSDPLLCLVID